MIKPEALRGINLVEHQVNNYAGYRDIQPERQRPTRNPAVPDEISSRCPVQRNEYQRHDDDRENCMRCQDCEIQRTRQALSGKFGGAVKVMISEIGNEKEC